MVRDGKEVVVVIRPGVAVLPCPGGQPGKEPYLLWREARGSTTTSNSHNNVNNTHALSTPVKAGGPQAVKSWSKMVIGL